MLPRPCVTPVKRSPMLRSLWFIEFGITNILMHITSHLHTPNFTSTDHLIIFVLVWGHSVPLSLMNCNTKSYGCTVKRIKICDRLTLVTHIWKIFDLLDFKVNAGHLMQFSENGLQLKNTCSYGRLKFQELLFKDNNYYVFQTEVSELLLRIQYNIQGYSKVKTVITRHYIRL